MRDTIFAAPRESVGDFAFDEKVAEVFPDMIERSVPGYRDIVGAIGPLTRRFARPGTRLYDLGCSLGACAAEMLRAAPADCEIVAVDSSPAMAARAAAALRGVPGGPRVTVRRGDVTAIPLGTSSLVALNFTLQFIPPEKRAPLLEKTAAALVPGGALVLSEKFAFADPVIGDALAELHRDFKKTNGYSDLEISQKRAAIENVLIAEEIPVHLERLRRCGFSRAALWCLRFNFGSILAVK